MDGRAFLDSARLLLATPTEANRRSAVSRGYFAILNEARAALERWGFVVGATADIDASVIAHFGRAANTDAVRAWDVLDRLERNRQTADYFLTAPGGFADEREVRHLLQLAQTGIDLLDQLEADPARRAAVVAAIRAEFP
jgi:hypothetical protein